MSWCMSADKLTELADRTTAGHGTAAVHFSAAARRAAALYSDFFAPKASGKMDVLGLSLVTIGAKASVETQRLFEGGEYTKYLYLHGLSVETAEALAEFHHRLMRAGTGNCGRGLAAHPRSVPSEISRVEIFVRLSGVPESGGPDQAVCLAAARRERWRALDVGIPARAGADRLPRSSCIIRRRSISWSSKGITTESTGEHRGRS